MEDEEIRRRRTVRPDPDPTIATISLVKDTVSALERTLVARVDAMDRAQVLFNENLTRVPTAVDRAISQVEALLRSEILGNKEVYLEKVDAIEKVIDVFKVSISERFALNDQQTEKAFNAAKQAVNEQNNANAQAVTKSEINVAKSVEDLRTSVKTLGENTDKRIEQNKNGVDDKINDMKDRISALENRIIGGESRASVSEPATATALRDNITALASLATSRDRGDGGKEQSDARLYMIITVATLVLSAIYTAYVVTHH